MTDTVEVRVGSCEHCGYDYTEDKLKATVKNGAVICPRCKKESYNWD